jgi:hypothetical protein
MNIKLLIKRLPIILLGYLAACLAAGAILIPANLWAWRLTGNLASMVWFSLYGFSIYVGVLVLPVLAVVAITEILCTAPFAVFIAGCPLFDSFRFLFAWAYGSCAQHLCPCNYRGCRHCCRSRLLVDCGPQCRCEGRDDEVKIIRCLLRPSSKNLTGPVGAEGRGFDQALSEESGAAGAGLGGDALEQAIILLRSRRPEAPYHSINSSAAMRMDCGTASSSVFTVRV